MYPTRRKRVCFATLATLLGVLTALLVCEIALRLITQRSEGDLYIRGVRLSPYHLPKDTIRSTIQAYLQANNHYMVWDAYLGWTLEKNAVGRDGLYRTNSVGIRSEPREFSPDSGDLYRIAVFGDSFAHGDEGLYSDCWPAQMERALGPSVEVLNFGVSGYGTDQAFLRWQSLGKKFSPDLVLIVFQPENIERNVNIFRPIYYPETQVPFFKPRFVLTDNGLELVASPAIPPAKILSILEGDIEDFPYIEHEYWFCPELYHDHHWLFKSRLINFLYSYYFARKCMDKEGIWSEASEPFQVTREIMLKFVEDVENSGAKPVVVILPRLGYLRRCGKSRECPYEPLIADWADAGVEIINPTDVLFESLKESGVEAMFVEHGHYSAFANRIVARVVAKRIHSLLPTE